MEEGRLPVCLIAGVGTGLDLKRYNNPHRNSTAFPGANIFASVGCLTPLHLVVCVSPVEKKILGDGPRFEED